MMATRFWFSGSSLKTTQFFTSSQTNRTLFKLDLWVTIAHSVLGSKCVLVLNETALDINRPSTSGRATFIAISREDRPESEISHSS